MKDNWNNKWVNITIKLNRSVHSDIKFLAEYTRQTQSEIINEACEFFLDCIKEESKRLEEEKNNSPAVPGEL